MNQQYLFWLVLGIVPVALLIMYWTGWGFAKTPKKSKYDH